MLAEFVRTTLQLALKYGITSTPQLNDPSFVSRIVFDPSRPQGTPKARFAYIFPAKDSALIQVRLRPDLTEGERDDAIALIRRAVAMPDWRLPNGKGTYVVTGAPVVVGELTDSISRLDPRAARRRARRHGAHARARLPRAAAAAAAASSRSRRRR